MSDWIDCQRYAAGAGGVTLRSWSIDPSELEDGEDVVVLVRAGTDPKHAARVLATLAGDAEPYGPGEIGGGR